jgi:hypothetical protein
MEIDTRFPTKLDAISDAPQPLRSALVESVPSKAPVRLLIYAPAFSTANEKSPATVLAVSQQNCSDPAAFERAQYIRAVARLPNRGSADAPAQCPSAL